MDIREDSFQGLVQVHDCGQMPYRQAYALQESLVAKALSAREDAIQESDAAVHKAHKKTGETSETVVGRVLLLEHEPVITISGRKGAADHLLASQTMLERAGVALEQTNRGGDITYHGPGQLIVYPILDLNLLMLRLHDYMRLLEQVVIETIAEFGIVGLRDPGATGVWVERDGTLAKIAAMGVRVRRWISMHGLALNVTTNLEHFKLIVPCGLAGRPVTSLSELLGEDCPSMDCVKEILMSKLRYHLTQARRRAIAHRRAAEREFSQGKAQGSQP